MNLALVELGLAEDFVVVQISRESGLIKFFRQISDHNCRWEGVGLKVLLKLASMLVEELLVHLVMLVITVLIFVLVFKVGKKRVFNVVASVMG